MYNNSNNSHQKESEVTWYHVFLVVGLIGCLGIYKNFPKIERFYFNHYEGIYLLAYAFVALLCALIGRAIVKNTKEISRRVSLLLEAKNGLSIFVGRTMDGCPVSISESLRTGHVQIIGSTGRGKTKSVITSWLSRDILKGKSAILIDGKGDPQIVEEIKRAIRPGVNLEVFDLGNPLHSNVLNPLENGSAQQITDRIFTAFEFQDPYYKAVQYDITGNVIRLIQEVDFYEYHGPSEYKKFPGIVTFKRLNQLLNDDVTLLEAIGESKDKALKEKLSQYLTKPKTERMKELSGLLSQIGPFSEGEVSHLVNGSNLDDKKPKRSINISNVLSKVRGAQTVLVILIPTLKYQQIGHQLGKLLLQELGWAVGVRASQGAHAPFLPVYLDEFASFVYPGFANILNKARSSNVALHLSHQSLGDLGTVSNDFANIIMSNTNVKCILGLNDPESADYIARHLGTHSERKLTERGKKDRFFGNLEKTGDLSMREVEAYKVHPNTLKNLSHGLGVIHLPTRLGTLTETVQFAAFSPMEMERR